MRLEKHGLTALALLLMLLMMPMLSGCSSDGDGFSEPTADPVVDPDPTDPDPDPTDPDPTDPDPTDPDPEPVVVILTNGTENPVYAEVVVSTRNISIAGVGQLQRAGFQVSVYDNSGSLINDAEATINNVRVSFVSSPNGGEYLQGTSADNTVDKAFAGDEIAIRTVNGQVTADLISGTRPGLVELRVEILQDNGTSHNPPLQATLPYVAIASGVAHTIAFSWPDVNAVEVIKGGMYKRIGTIQVGDQFGNAVPDGTVIYLSMINSLFAQDNDASIVATESRFRDDASGAGNASNFTTDFVVRNGVAKHISANDQVLIWQAGAGDKRRFVASDTLLSNELQVHSAYINTTNSGTVATDHQQNPSEETGLVYVVGTNSSDIGGAMIGMDEIAGIERPGVAVTKNGKAHIFILYPADESTILIGCMDNDLDTRYRPNSSADLYIVASSSDNEVTAIDGLYKNFSEPKGCFESVSGWGFNSFPNAYFGGAGFNGTLEFDLELEDGGDKIGLPFIPILATVKITRGLGICSIPSEATETDCTDIGGAWTPNDFWVTVPNTCPSSGNRTIVRGFCDSQAIVTGSTHNKGDKAEITYYGGDAQITVSFEITN